MAKSKKISRKKPIKTLAGSGRPGVDWPVLFDLWVVSGKEKKEFLESYGINLKSSQTRIMTKSWTSDAKIAEREVAELRLQQRVKSAEKEIPQADPGLWQFVQQMRKGQAGSDWKTAEAIRQHVKMVLQKNVLQEIGQPPESKLTPRELCNLAEALERLQRIQRLALGLSTDNVGLTGGDDGDDGAIDLSDSVPTFVVEVNDSGKFTRARPRQINGVVSDVKKAGKGKGQDNDRRAAV